MAKNNTIIPKWTIIAAAIILISLWLGSIYNNFVTLEVKVEQAWSDVEVQYQRRADLVAELLGIVEGAADFEKSTLLEVTSARTNWLNAQNEGDINMEIEAATAFDSALSRLLVTVEAYPTLTATEGFKNFQVEMAGTENRIAIAREDYNSVVSEYSLATRRFPGSVLAKLFGFDTVDLFESNAGTETAPTLEFDF